MPSQVKVLRSAERLATALMNGPLPVSRNVFLSLVAGFMGSAIPDIARLKRTAMLVKSGGGGHLKRGGGYSQQLRAAAEEITEFMLREHLEPEEYKSVFGWTGRLLMTRGRPPSAGAVGREESLPRNPISFRKPPLESHKSHAGAFGNLKESGLAALRRLQERLDEEAPEEKD